MTSDDDRLAAELAEQAGTLLLGLRAGGGDAGDLRKAGDRRSHEFLAAELAARRPGDAVLSEEGRDDRARLYDQISQRFKTRNPIRKPRLSCSIHSRDSVTRAIQ